MTLAGKQVVVGGLSFLFLLLSLRCPSSTPPSAEKRGIRSR